MENKKRLSSKESELDNIIPPEIKNDEFYNIIIQLTAAEKIKTVLEIGSSDGSGSTEAFVEGLKRNGNNPLLFCLEVSKPRFEKLEQRYRDFDSVKCYNYSSVSKEKFPAKENVENFYHRVNSNLNNYPLERILGWLEQDMEYLENHNIRDNGIKKIKEENGIFYFDMVLIDGSEFTGEAELEEVYGAKYILLDDIKGYKNFRNYIRLLKDANYDLIIDNKELRNGYAVFKRVCSDLPVHFFTIVLNGLPFMKYHIEILSKLPFKWHWHIIEGVADLKHDTAWSLNNGGHIPDDFIKNGLSNDGTTELIDELKTLYPDNITVYRKPDGRFWDGKLEMVNAPLPNIKEECLLWQLDADELWNVNQIIKARNLFIANPQKKSAYYYCSYFVNENLVTSTVNTYGNYTSYEWLRTWRYEPGDKWMSHEPPRLSFIDKNNNWTYKSTLDKFLHEETKKEGLVFQHYAYVLPEQLLFKEKYYGYGNALESWEELGKCTNFPVKLKDYFNWVKDDALVDTADKLNIKPFFVKNENGGWSVSQAAFDECCSAADDNGYKNNVLTIDNLKDYKAVEIKKRSRKNILVVSHERSGTHFLINAIARNFLHYSNEEISLLGSPPELKEIFEKLNSVEERRIIKSHHQIDFFREILSGMLEHFHIFYIVRDGRDVLTSFYHYSNEAPEDKFPHTKSISELLSLNPAGYEYDNAYSLNKSQNVVERWVKHVEGWLEVEDKINVIKYEDLMNNFEDEIKHIAGILKQPLPAQITKPDLKDRTISPRKGIVGDWRNHFNREDESLFNAFANNLMQRLGYYPEEQNNLPDAEKVKSIVIVRIDSIGDALLASSIIKPLKEKYADPEITIICQEHIAELYEGTPLINKVITIDKKRMSEDADYKSGMITLLSNVKADLVIHSIYSREPLGDLVAAAINTKARIGFEGDLNNITEEQRNLHNRFYTHLIHCNENYEPELNRHKRLLDYLGIKSETLHPVIWLTDKDKKFADDFLSSNNIKPNQYIVLFGGAQKEERKYTGFGKAINNLAVKNNLTVIALGSQEDYEINQLNLNDIQNATINLSGKTSIKQAAALISKAALAVGTETGLAHAACAVGTPNVILLGGGHFGRFMPYSNLTSVVALPLDCYGCDWKCKFDHAYCVKDVDYRAIEKAVEESFHSSSSKARIFVQTAYTFAPGNDKPVWRHDGKYLNSLDVEIIKVKPEVSEEEIESLIENGNYEEALKHIHSVLNYDGNDVNALNNLAAVQILLKRWEDASATLGRIIKIDPSY